MTLKLSDRDVEALLRDQDRDVRPPADLLARLRADLPAELPAQLPPREPEGGKVLRPARWNPALLSLAATLAVLVGGSLIAYRSFREPQVPWPAETAAVKQDVAPAGRDEPAVQPAFPAASAPVDISPPPAPLRQERPAPPAEVAGEKTQSDPLKMRANARLGSGQLLQAPPPADEKELVGGILLEVQETDAAAAPAAGTVASAPAPAEPLAASREEAAPLAPRALENPGIEANSRLAGPAPGFAEAEKRKDRMQLESPTTQGDALRAEVIPASAAAVPKPATSMAAGGDLGEAWRKIERDLAGGAWPKAEAIAAARLQVAPEPLSPRARTLPRGAVLPVDPSATLRDDLLDFFAREEHGRHYLLDLRRRALRLAEKHPDDQRIQSLLRLVNLAIKLSPD